LGDLDIYKIILDTAEHTHAVIRFTFPNTKDHRKSKQDTLFIVGSDKADRPWKYLPNQAGVYSVILKRGYYDMWINIEGYQTYVQQLYVDEYDYYPVVKEESIDLVPAKL